jgi:Cation/multidrug efflux pump
VSVAKNNNNFLKVIGFYSTNPKVESIKSRLPESVQKNGVSVAKNNNNFLKVIGFYSTDPQKTQADIADFIYSTVQDPIRRVQGVGDTQSYWFLF